MRCKIQDMRCTCVADGPDSRISIKILEENSPARRLIPMGYARVYRGYLLFLLPALASGSKPARQSPSNYLPLFWGFAPLNPDNQAPALTTLGLFYF